MEWRGEERVAPPPGQKKKKKKKKNQKDSQTDSQVRQSRSPALKNNPLLPQHNHSPDALHHLPVVRHDQNTTPLAPQPHDQVPDAPGALRIQAGGRFVQDQEPWAPHDGARNGEPLGLPAAESGAAGTDGRGVAERQRRDEAVDAGEGGGGAHAGRGSERGGLGERVGDVGSDGGGEEGGGLRHDGDERAQRRQVQG